MTTVPVSVIEPVASVHDSPPKVDAYAVFCGTIEQTVLSRIAQRLFQATNPQRNVGHMHILFHSTGGTVGDCICLYNLFRAFTLDLTLYNAGAIQSGAVTAYLGAKRRLTSAHSQFMIHRSYCNPQFSTLSRLESTVESLRMDDARTEAIIREHAALPEELWSRVAAGDVFITGRQAVAYGLAHEIGEFSPPTGAEVYNL